jgi:UDP-N-acetylglucosamine 2-epimerase (non-hydrolysing)
MIKIFIVFGTRPEAIKMAPVVEELRKYPDLFKIIVCSTAQHREMLDQVISLFKIKLDIDLNLMQKDQTLHSLTSKAMEMLSEQLIRVKPDIVLVQGDTTTAMVAALASFYCKIPVGHIEAGLRTNNIYSPFPEEVNRRLITALSTLNFAPTKNSAESLYKEGVNKKKVFLTGNTIVDALKIMIRKVKNEKLPLNTGTQKIILVTAHLRESFGKPIINICNALKEIVKRNKNIEIIYPVHRNPNIHNVVHNQLRGIEQIKLINPVEYDNLIFLLKKCYLVLTDSGGIQEEAPSFGKPVLVMRDTTERPEGIEAGVAKLVGTDTRKIVNETYKLLNDIKAYERMANAVNPYGDGKASKRIAKIIEKYFKHLNVD